MDEDQKGNEYTCIDGHPDSFGYESWIDTVDGEPIGVRPNWWVGE